ncbi:MAG: VWA domain-containing protein [Lachnospiraceae bacterium]|nr:VWA domain-containing protein [Lachnospiraceae bacterium]
MKKGIVTRLMIASIMSVSLTGCGAMEKSTSTADMSVAEYDNGSGIIYEDACVEVEAEAMDMAGVTMEEGGVTDFNTEEYHAETETAFAKTSVSPLSTFSADVDTASYSNLRRMIEDGYGLDEIPEGAVRIEEILNYFDYDYNLPEGDEPFGVTTQIADCPWNEENKLLAIGLKSEEIDFSESGSSNFVFLLDVSGSMNDRDKLPLLQRAFAVLAENLTEKDRVSIVTYAGDDRILLEGVSGDETEEIRDVLNDLEAGGSTNGSKGIETAYELAEEYFIEGGNNRVILATDGDLNVGTTSESELVELIEEKRENGIYLTVLGFGTGNLKDNKMEALADNGNGNYAYIDSLGEAKKVLVEEMGSTLVTVAKDVKLQVEFNPEKVSEYRLIGYENRRLDVQDFEDDTKDAGEIGAGHTVTALYEIVPTVEGDEVESDLKYSETVTNGSNEWLTVSIRYKEPEGEESILLEYPVDESSYTENPSDDWKFAAAAAEFGLVVTDSDFQGAASLEHVKDVLKELDIEEDEYKEEFYDLVKKLIKNS